MTDERNPAAVLLGSKGGEATKKKYGKKHFQDIGKKGGKKKRKAELNLR